MDENKRNEIAEKLQEKGANNPCPRCGNSSFAIVDGYFNHPIQEELTGLVLGEQSLPTAITICKKCGFLSQHALGALGLIEKEIKRGVNNEYE
jgi:ribosomal protein S27AE